MTDEEREKVKAKAITMEITANDFKKALDGTNPVGLFLSHGRRMAFIGVSKGIWGAQKKNCGSAWKRRG